MIFGHHWFFWASAVFCGLLMGLIVFPWLWRVT